MFFKSPYHAAGEIPVHDLFKQEKLLLDWARTRAHAGGPRANAPAAPAPHANRKSHVERTAAADGELYAAVFGGKPAIPGPSQTSHTLWPIITNDERVAVNRVLDRGILSGSFAPRSMALRGGVRALRRRQARAAHALRNERARRWQHRRGRRARR